MFSSAVAIQNYDKCFTLSCCLSVSRKFGNESPMPVFPCVGFSSRRALLFPSPDKTSVAHLFYLHAVSSLCIDQAKWLKKNVQSKALPANGNSALLKTGFRVVFQLHCGEINTPSPNFIAWHPVNKLHILHSYVMWTQVSPNSCLFKWAKRYCVALF